MTLFKAITPILLLLAAPACAPPPLCSTQGSCNEVAADAGEAPPPDLPCGGADLLTDDDNCGVCGNACDISWPDSIYSSGHCIDGECAPLLVQCGLFTEGVTCAQICQGLSGRACVSRGCPGVENEGVTALIYHPGMAMPCLPELPNEEFVLDCDAPLPYTTQYDSRAHCCCL